MKLQRTVRFSDSAGRDLESIGDWIARDNPTRAISFLEEIINVCAELATLSERFQLMPRYPNVRRRVYGLYVIFYRVNDEFVTITHILNGAVDFDAWDFDRD